MSDSAAPKKAQLNPFVKLALDFGPLILFFIVNGRAGIFWATGIFMAAVIVAIFVSYAMIKRFPIMTLVTAFIVIVFGTLTIVLQNDIFVKMKTTIIYLMFAVVLIAGLILRKPFLEIAFDSVFHLTDEGLAQDLRSGVDRLFHRDGGHQRSRRAHADDRFLGRQFKTFGFVPITFAFALAHFRCCRNTRDKTDEAPYSAFAASAFSIAGINAVLRLVSVIGPDQLGDAAIASDDEGFRARRKHPIRSPRVHSDRRRPH